LELASFFVKSLRRTGAEVGEGKGDKTEASEPSKLLKPAA
jgi:hypothetical protein